MSVSVVSILTADHAALLAEENARLECRIQELEGLLHAAHDDLASMRDQLAQEKAKNKRMGW